MENDAYFKKLNKKAKKENKRFDQTTPAPKLPKQSGTYSFLAFFGLVPVFGWLLIATIIFLMGLLFYYARQFDSKPEEQYIYDYTLYLTSGFLALVLLWTVVRYFVFRGWVERLPFPVKGWTELIRRHRMGSYRHCRYITITLHPKPNTNEHHGVLKDAMQILFNRVDKSSSVKVDNQIHEWEKITDFCFKGPVDLIGMRRLKKSFKKELTQIAKRLDCIDKLEITVHTQDFNKSAYRRTDRIPGLDY